LTRFAHESEEYIAAILDYHGIKWEYEKKTFIIKTDEQGTIKRAFTPDFYLPEFDTYIEVTVMKKATRKRKKIIDTLNLNPTLTIMLIDRDILSSLEEEYNSLINTCTSEEDVL
jgi:hypothetical protein